MVMSPLPSKYLFHCTFDARFIDMADRHYTEIHDTHSHMTGMMRQIQLENSLARRHMKELEHEKVVLDERKMVGRYRETIQYNTTREQSRSATHEGAGA